MGLVALAAGPLELPAEPDVPWASRIAAEPAGRAVAGAPIVEAAEGGVCEALGPGASSRSDGAPGPSPAASVVGRKPGSARAAQKTAPAKNAVIQGAREYIPRLQ